MYSTRAIRFIQNRRVFYSVVIPAGKLIEMTKVDIWDPEDPSKGYQRMPSEARKRDIGNYVMNPASIMPVGGLLNARDEGSLETGDYGSKLKFSLEYSEGSISHGILTIPRNALPLYIVDMQHRIGGYEWAIRQLGGEYLENFPLGVIIADGLTKMEEIDQFELINTTQKKVRTDLARRIKSIQLQNSQHKIEFEANGKLWEARGPIIAEKLNSIRGPWYGKILPPNKPSSEQSTMITRETSFVTSLKPILHIPYFIFQTEDTVAELINRYWNVIQKIWPEAFENPREYVIQKTPGIFSLHEIAPEIFGKAQKLGDLSYSNIFEIAKSLVGIGDSSFWLAGERTGKGGAANYGGMKGFKALASELRSFLKQ